MRIKHTLGPWFLVNSDRSYYEDCAIIETGFGEEVLGVSEWIRADAPDLRLMAAAPEMLEMLEEIARQLRQGEDIYEWYSEIADTIKKAKGEQQ